MFIICRHYCCAAKINEETGDDLDDNVMFDDVDGEEDDIDDVSLPLFLLIVISDVAYQISSFILKNDWSWGPNYCTFIIIGFLQSMSNYTTLT